jgi:hypothetical protein
MSVRMAPSMFQGNKFVRSVFNCEPQLGTYSQEFLSLLLFCNTGSWFRKYLMCQQFFVWKVETPHVKSA